MMAESHIPGTGSRGTQTGQAGGPAGGPAGSPGGAGTGNTSTYDYYEIGGPGQKWAGRGRQQRHAQRQRARGAGMGALGESYANSQQFFQGQGQSDRNMQLGMMDALGVQGDRFGALAGQYGDLARGRGTSLAQSQLAQAQAQNVADQMAMAAAARGGSLAAQQRQATAAGAAAQQAAAQQASQLRAQEQQMAMAGLGQTLGQQTATVEQQTELANAMRQQSLAAELGYADQALQHQLGHRGIDQQALDGRRAFATNLVGSILGGAGGVAGAAASLSDERTKQHVGEGGLAATQAVGKMKPKTWEYKPGYGAPGERVGVMAQDVERQYPSLVQDTPLGKAVDVGGMSALALAASSEQQREIETLQRRIAQMEGGQ